MSEKKAPEWSATFQRLRAETTVVALLIFTFSHASVSLEKLPVLGIDIKGGAPKGALLTFMLLFWGYFTFSWCIRYWADRKHELLDDDRINTFLRLSQEAPGTLNRWKDRDTRQLAHPLTAVVERLEIEISKFPDVDRLKETQELLRARSGPEMVNTRYDNQNGILLGEMKMLADRLNDLRGDVSNRTADLLQAIKEYTAEIAAAEAAIPFAVKTIEDSAQKIKNELSSIKSVTVWDRIWLGFIIPLGFTALLVIVSLRPVAAEVSPFLSQSYVCLTASNSECWVSNSPKQ